ncbi:MAG TPA: pyruvate kinase [Candidatus Hydrogenedentes bacterium]|nr:pyruvate kinase [Candidatus Hydrogenedentota bacterium]
MTRRAKIVCTIGPASSSSDVIRRLILSGMDVARLNFSHGTHEDHRALYTLIRSTAEDLGVNVAILMDLQGPKIRTGKMKDGQEAELRNGETITITTRDVPGSAQCISTTYEHLPQDVKPGDTILIADGIIELNVRQVNPPDVLCEVVRGGMLGQHKGINLPGVHIAEPSMTEKDRRDLAFGLELGVDYAALSFVRSPDDLRLMRDIIDASGKQTRIVAKIERPEALACFDDILALSDAIMVARGDLGVEMNFEDIPFVQKRLIQKCNACGIPVITATQMLESMTSHARPTRAEVTDVANAILDGTDAVMLSGETASGQFPVESCEVMVRIAAKAGEDMAGRSSLKRWEWLQSESVRQSVEKFNTPGFMESDAIGLAAAQMAESLHAKGIVCFTNSGFTAAAIARYRPKVPVIAFTRSDETCRRCALYWGVSAFKINRIIDLNSLHEQVDELLCENHLDHQGGIMVITGGTPEGITGRTNFLKIHKIGEIVS